MRYSSPACVVILGLAVSPPLFGDDARDLASPSFQEVVRSLVNAPSHRCATLQVPTTGIRESARGLDPDLATRLFGRVGVDVSPIGFATLMDVMADPADGPMYGILINSERLARADATDARINETSMGWNESRDAIGIVPIEIEQQVVRDFDYLGIDVASALVDTRALYECQSAASGSEVRQELALLMEASNKARATWQAADFSTESDSFAEVKARDQAGAAWVRKFLSDTASQQNTGLSRRELFDIFLLIQHSGDVALMREALPWIANRMLEGRLAGSNYALVVDRIAVFEKAPQIYGSQGEDRDGVVVPQPIAEPDSVEQRRALMRMRSMREYYEQMNR